MVDCTLPQPLPADTSNECAAPPQQHPTLAISNNTVMLVWDNGQGQLSYATWPVETVPSSISALCVPGPASGSAKEPQLAAAADLFQLIFSTDNGVIHASQFQTEQWSETLVALGNGRSPSIFIDNANRAPCRLV